ncbi:MAG: TldD/PmbA family protein [Candidatus Syntropharchaeia archaeon]
MDIIDKIIRKSMKIGIHTEIYVEKSRIDSFVGDIQKITKERSQICGMGIRVVKNGNLGNFSFSFGEILDNNRIFDRIKEFSMGMKVKKPPFTYTDEITRVDGLYDPKESFDTEEGIEICKNVISIAKDYDARIKNVRCQLTSCLREIVISNSFGIEKSLRDTRYHLSVSCSASGAQGMFSVLSRSHEMNPEETAEKAAKMAIKTISKRKIEKGRYNVVFHPFAVSSILSNLVPSICADKAGSLPLKKRIEFNPKISSDNVSMYDDGTIPGLVHSFPFDDEGWPTQINPIIENGFFRGFLYDNYTAQINDLFSTGNGRRSSYRSRIAVSPHNIILEGGDFSKDELIEEVRDGIFVFYLIGGKGDPASGRINATAFNSFRIERGEITFPIQNSFLNIDLYEFLGRIEMLSEEKMEISGASYSVVSPFVVMKDVGFYRD